MPAAVALAAHESRPAPVRSAPGRDARDLRQAHRGRGDHQRGAVNFARRPRVARPSLAGMGNSTRGRRPYRLRGQDTPPRRRRMRGGAAAARRSGQDRAGHLFPGASALAAKRPWTAGELTQSLPGRPMRNPREMARPSPRAPVPSAVAAASHGYRTVADMPERRRMQLVKACPGKEPGSTPHLIPDINNTYRGTIFELNLQERPDYHVYPAHGWEDRRTIH